MRAPVRFGALVLALAVLAPAQAQAQAPQIKTQVPDFKLSDPDGNTVTLKEHLKKGPVLLNFWTTWCKPCQKELPELAKLYEKYKDKGFTLLAVSEDDQRTQARVRPTVKSRGYEFPVLVDPDRRVGNLFGVRSYPTNVFISSDGSIALSSIGYRKGDEKKIEAQIEKLVGAETPKEPGNEAGEGESAGKVEGGDGS